MNKEIKTKWIEALRSGEYVQAQGYLHNSKGYCCLGVLCDIYQKETGNGEWVKENDYNDIETFILGDERKIGTLPEAVMEWAGLSEKKSIPLAMANDSQVKELRADFSEIAKMIEKDY